MPSTIKVRLIDSSRDDVVADLALPSGTTYEDFVLLYKIDTSKSQIRVRDAAQNVLDFLMEDEIADGVQITVTPTNIKGA